MNQYETVFILTPVLSDVQMKEAVEKFKGVLQAEGCWDYQWRKLGTEEIGLPNSEEVYRFLPTDWVQCRSYCNWQVGS